MRYVYDDLYLYDGCIGYVFVYSVLYNGRFYDNEFCLGGYVWYGGNYYWVIRDFVIW